ncbi:MAG: SPFH domain-containing protein, partial [Oscillospiraceae bacterium]|nr:SPFH domain-containing protein [Oscillospiraceae bacterium]
MLQRVIRDPGGNSLIRVIPELCGPGRTVVNGSVLLVPAGTQAFVALNGQVVGPYWPGRYELMTGVDPFFVRLCNLMTGGEAPVSVTVFFVSTQKTKFMQLGTGLIPFEERRYRLTMEALASCSLAYRITDPLRTLETMVGTYQAVFSDEDLEPCLRQLMLAPLRQNLAVALNRHTIVEFNRSLGAIGTETRGPLAQALAEYGLSLEQFTVTAVNISDEGWARLHELESKEAAGRTQTDLEKDHLERIWGGNLDRRTLAEAMTGLPARGS